jgi:two-component system cell cycle sensor histidine kinase/response regulator CckA
LTVGSTPPIGARESRPAGDKDGRGTSLHAYFAFLIVVFIAAGGAAALYVHVQAGSDAETAAARSSRFAAKTAAGQLGESIAAVQASVAGLAATPNIGRAVTHPAGCSLAYANTGSDLGHIDIIRADGTPTCTSRKSGSKPFPHYGGAWLKRARVAPILEAPVLDTATGHRVVIAASPIPGGVVAAFYDLTSAGPKLAELFSGGQPVSFLVTTGDGRTVVTRSIDPERWIGASLEGTTFLPVRRTGERRDLDGDTRLYQSATVPGTGWTFYAGADKADVLAGRALLQERQLLIIVIGFIAFLLATLLVYRRVGRPLALLDAAVRSSARQPEPTLIPIPTHGAAEVRRLGDDVNALISSRARSEETYRNLFDHHPAPMWVFDQDTLQFLAVNEAAISSYGYSRAEFLSKTVDEIRPVEDRAALREAMSDPLRGAVKSGTWRHLKKDGTVIDAMISSDAIDFEGRSARLVLAQDVTETLRLEEQVRQSQKMEAIGSLAGGIAHDFNNIVMVIRACCALLLPRLPDTDVHEDLDQIDKAAQRAAGLTRQLLAFSRQQVLRPEVTNPNMVIGEILELLQRVIGEDIEIVRELEPEPESILVDPGQLGQVILNLAVNAREAMSTGGTLIIGTSNVTVDEAYASTHLEVPLGHYVLLQFTDTGVGMDELTRSRAFDPFFTSKDSGTGLGLATVYGIVKQSGGHIWLYSEPGLGTTFKLFFPSTTKPAKPSRAPSAVGSLDGRETILLVEDEEVLRRLISTALRDYGYTVIEASNGSEALEKAKQHPEPIHLLLTDVVMPGMNGSDLAARLLSDRPGTAVLFTSGYPSDMIVRHGVADGIADYIEKPYALTDLARLIRELLSRHQSEAALLG